MASGNNNCKNGKNKNVPSILTWSANYYNYDQKNQNKTNTTTKKNKTAAPQNLYL